jgi:V8-like Glu-specific endopeptidase
MTNRPFQTKTKLFVAAILIAIAILANTAWAGMALKYTWQERTGKGDQTQHVVGKQYLDTVTGVEKTEYYDLHGQLISNPADWGLRNKSWQNNHRRWMAAAPAAAIPGFKSAPFSVPSFLLTKSLSAPSAALDGMTTDAIAKLQTIQQSSPGKPQLIGVRRPLPAALENSVARSANTANSGWQTDAQGNHYLRQRITVTDTKAIRIYLENIKLPAGAYFMVYATQNPGECRGPYDAMLLQGRDKFWTESIFASDVTLAAVVPFSADPTTLSFAVNEIVDIFALPLLSTFKAGDCNKDVTCYRDWQSQAAGVAGIGTINETGALWCTGALLNDSGEPRGNYFITAYHCVGNQKEADTSEYYWFYQTSTCNDAPPSPSEVPRTGGGATFLAGMSKDAGNDFSFIQLNQAVPTTVQYAGWTSDIMAQGDAVTGIHHPDGSYKRISFGMLRDYNDIFWAVQWQQGVTEKGSSGSPLFNARQQFVGQLQGGDSSCDNLTGIDWYGRFDVTYPIIAQWLTIPDEFTFTDQTGVALSTVITSNTITVSGITAAAPISINGGTYSINGGAYTSASGMVSNGNTVTVQQTSSGSFSTTTNAILTISGLSGTFSVTTLPAVTSSGGGGECFIATAAFGSPLAEQVEVLRQFRDRYLLTNALGQKVVAWYYRNSPAAAKYVKDKPLVKAAVRLALYPLIGFSLMLISGYLPFVIVGLLLSALLFFRFKQKKLSATLQE